MVLARYGDSISSEDASLLGESIRMPFSGRVAKSRFLKGGTFSNFLFMIQNHCLIISHTQTMSERMASWDWHDVSKRGIPSDDLVGLYEGWGKAGYGIIITGNVMLHPTQLEAPGNPLLYAPYETSERMEQFRKMAAAGKIHGSLMIMQVSHPGRQVPIQMNPNPVGASDIHLADSLGMSFGKPTPLDKSGIREVVDQFAYVAEAAYRTGFDGVQLHGAHGFLIAQFLSQTTNNRTDEYGGSMQNRSRIIKEIVEAIRERVPDRKFVIGIKVNSVEFQAKGFQPEEAAELCQQLEAMEIDFVELSGGTHEAIGFKHTDSDPRESTVKREAFYTKFAQQITPKLNKTVVYVTGGFRSASAMAEAIRSGSCAGVGLGRPSGSDPLLPIEIIEKKATGASDMKISPNDFASSFLASSIQMQEIGQGKPVIDLTEDEGLARFQKIAEEVLSMRSPASGKLHEAITLAKPRPRQYPTIKYQIFTLLIMHQRVVPNLVPTNGTKNLTRSNSHGLSDRAASYMEGLRKPSDFECNAMLYHKNQNPNGIIKIAIAENSLLSTELVQYFNTHFKLTTSHLKYRPSLVDGYVNSTEDILPPYYTTYFKPRIPITQEHCVHADGIGSLLAQVFWALCDVGDGVLMTTPYYDRYPRDIIYPAQANVIPAHVPADVDPLSKESIPYLRKELDNVENKIKVIILCNPHNPLANAYPEEMIIEYAKLAEEFDVHLLVDEVYGLQVFSSRYVPNPVPFKSILSLELPSTIDLSRIHVVLGPTKDFGSSGLKLGSLVSQYNPDLLTSVRSAVQAVPMSSATDALFTQALGDVEFREWFLEENRRRLAVAFERVGDWCTFHKLPFVPASAGVFFIVDLEPILPPAPTPYERAIKGFQKMRDAGVYLVPTSISEDPVGTRYRMTFTLPPDTMKLALRRIERAFGLNKWDGLGDVE
ncbi:NADH:flavin oxidoreductase / NADH oxidase family, partial [Rhizoctonia solani]